MKHCDTCRCGEPEIVKRMSTSHMLAPCCGDVTIPALMKDGRCPVCREEFVREGPRQILKTLYPQQRMG